MPTITPELATRAGTLLRSFLPTLLAWLASMARQLNGEGTVRQATHLYRRFLGLPATELGRGLRLWAAWRWDHLLAPRHHRADALLRHRTAA